MPTTLLKRALDSKKKPYLTTTSSLRPTLKKMVTLRPTRTELLSKLTPIRVLPKLNLCFVKRSQQLAIGQIKTKKRYAFVRKKMTVVMCGIRTLPAKKNQSVSVVI